MKLKRALIFFRDTYLLLAEFSVRTGNYSTDRKNEANKMFIVWLLPVWETLNKCRTHDLTVI